MQFLPIVALPFLLHSSIVCAFSPTPARKSPLTILPASKVKAEFQVQTGAVFKPATKVFPGALTYNELMEFLTDRLKTVGYSPSSNMLCGTSLCGDEKNRPLETSLAAVFKSRTFRMGGSAGYPLGGVMAFTKMKEHFPVGGSGLIVHGPHVGLSSDGRIGHVDRKGIEASTGEHTWCCRSAIIAANRVGQELRGEVEPLTMDPLDASQYFVTKYLKPYASKLEQSADEAGRMIDLVYALVDSQTPLMDSIVKEGSQAGIPGDIAVLGGIQINTPTGFLDYFLPLRFDLFGADGDLKTSLLE